MGLKKESMILILLGTVLLSGCALNSSEQSLIEGQPTKKSELKNNQATMNSEQESETWSSENNEVKVSAIKINEFGTPEFVSVEVNGKKKEFNWIVAEKPQIFFTDVTGDSKPEAIIINNIGRGTGLSVNEVHVLNSDDLSEIKVPSFEEIARDHIETHVIKNDKGNLKIKVNALGENYEFTYNVDPSVEVQDKLLFGGSVTYALEKQKVILNIGGSVGTSPIYVTGFHVTYQFDSSKNEFFVDQIEVKSYGS